MAKKKKSRKGEKRASQPRRKRATMRAPSRAHLSRTEVAQAREVDASVYSLDLGRVALPLGGVALMKKSGATRKQALLEEAPVFHGLVDAAFQAHLDGKRAEVSATVPASEITAVVRFLAEHTTRLELINGMDWAKMTTQERMGFYEHMGITNMLGVYQSYTTMAIIKANPHKFGQVAFEIKVADSPGEEE